MFGFVVFVSVTIGLILQMIFDFDLEHFIRASYYFLNASWFRPKVGFLDFSEIYGICLPSDVNFIMTQMRCYRYQRESTFGYIDLTVRNGLLGHLLRRGRTFPIAVSAITIRYSLPIKIFSTYKVVTQPLWWDEQYFYVDQRVITLSDNEIRTIGFAKIAVSKLNLEEFVQKFHPRTEKPDISDELKAWIETIDLSKGLMKTSQDDLDP